MSSYLVCNIIIIKDKKEVLYHKEFTYNQIRDDYEEMDEINVDKLTLDLINSVVNTHNSYDVSIYDSSCVLNRIMEIQQDLEDTNKPIDYSSLSLINFKGLSSEDAVDVFMNIKKELEEEYQPDKFYIEELTSLLAFYHNLFYGMQLLKDMYDDYGNNNNINIYLHTRIE